MTTTINDNNETTQIKYLTNQLNVARNEINNLRQQLKALTQSHRKECDDIKKKLEMWRCLECRNRQVFQDRAGCSGDAGNCSDLQLRYIGVISTHFPEKRGTPRQPGICSNLVAKLTLNNDVFTNPEHALEGLQEFSHIWILFHFHKNESTHVRAKVSPPRLNGLRTGVYATRSPHRPCPIGLSLVRIDRIMENHIYFSGVDMVDQTPVLDIKPYIPQYDNPTLISSITFGDNNTVDGIYHNINDFNRESNTQQLTFEMDSLNVRVMDGEENGGGRNDAILGAASSTGQNARSDTEEFYSRSNSRIGEREAPDGEEEESPRQPQTTFNHPVVPSTPEGNIRVPSWIHQPPVSTLTVLFKDRALAQLQQLGSEGDVKKTIITNVLREDPRSVYLRERWGSHCYVFRIADLYVSCKFNDSAHSVTVYQAFQNSETEPDE